jgi:error-prone DNA polymerase
MTITMIGLDTAKSSFQIHAVDASGKAVLKRKLRRSEVLPFFEQQARCVVVLEACGAAHHWSRLIAAHGHETRLIAPEAVRPFVKKGKKNDAADAEAICEAASRPNVKFVPTKDVEQQAVLSLHSVRALLIKQRTMLVNAMRGLATEFGIVAPKGIGKVTELLEFVNADEGLPRPASQAIRELSDQCASLSEGIETFETEIVHHARSNEVARRLATIPGVGPVTASLITATVSDIGVFPSARHFAAWLGLVPRQNSTGGKSHLGRITKAGHSEIRRMLVLGATSMIFRAEKWNSSLGAWTRSAMLRRPVRLVTVALANKIARIAWALITRNDVYRPTGQVAAAAQNVR